MKRIVPTLFAFLLLLSLAATTAFAEVPSAQAQLELLAQHSHEWLESDPILVGDIWYTVTDLDQNGRLEIIRSSQLGRCINYPTSIFEVNAAGSGIDPVDFPQGDTDISPRLVYDFLFGFIDGEDVRLFVSEDWGDPIGGGSHHGLMTMKDGRVSIERLSDDYYNIISVGTASYTTYDQRSTPAEAAADQKYEKSDDMQYSLHWENLTSGSDVRHFLQAAWKHFTDPEFEWGEYLFPNEARAQLYFPTSEHYHDFDGKVLRINSGFEYFTEDCVRVVTESDNVTLRLDALDYAKLADYDENYAYAYNIFSFTPQPGKVYEIPFSQDSIGLCRLTLENGPYSESIYSILEYEFGRPLLYSDYQLVAIEQHPYPWEWNAISGICQSMAGWVLDSAAPEDVVKSYWDVVSNAISFNMADYAMQGNDWYFNVPKWLVNEYTGAMFGSLDWNWEEPEMTATSALRTVKDNPYLLSVIPNLRFDRRWTRINQVLSEGDPGFEPEYGDYALEVIVTDDYDHLVVFYLRECDNIFGWTISHISIGSG